MEVSEEQRALEVESHRLGVDRYRSSANKAAEMGMLSVTKPGSILLAAEIHGLDQAIENWMKESRSKAVLEFFGPFEPSVLAGITAQTMIDAATKGLQRSTVVCKLASRIRDDGMLATLRRQHSPLFSRMRSLKTSIGTQVKLAKRWAKRGMWDHEEHLREDQIRGGLVLYSLALENTKIFRQISLQQNKRTLICLTLTPECMEWVFKSHAEHEVLSPIYLPMVQVPVDWAVDQRGGYYTEEARRRPLCRTQRASHSKLLQRREMPEVYSAVNLAQRTAWRVNPDVLQVLETAWEGGGGYAGVPKRAEPEFPERPFDPGDTEGPEAEAARERLKNWKRHVAIELERFQDEGSARLRHARCLHAAKRFEGKTIYYPHFIDWRGRLYPTPQFLNHQGADLARALLQFDAPSYAEHGSPEAEHYLAFGTELWKGDIPTGIVDAVYQDPLACDEWKNADKPWQFLAWCLEAGAWFEDEGSPIHQPIQADGTNNGLQIYSLLTLDETMARCTNVSPGDRSDIYQDVADAVWQEVLEDPSELAATWRSLLPDGLDRSVVKLPVMAAPYGVRKHSVRGAIRSWLLNLQVEKGVTPWGHSTFKPTNWLADKVWDRVGDHIGPARKVMDWMREVAMMVEGPLRWTTPVDLLVTQEYPKRTKRKLKVNVTSAMKYVRYRGYAPGVDRKRQADGFAPNYVHSLDSAALMRTMNRCADKGVTSFSMIHDSYGCPVGDTATMARELRQVFAEMFSEDLLTKLRDEVTSGTREQLPELPTMGSLDPTTVINSKHFFS